jgi:hypothetical protein
MKNYWVASKDDLAMWSASFSPVSELSEVDLKKLMQLSQSILELGEQERVYQVNLASEKNLIWATEGISNAVQCIKYQFEEEKRFFSPP